MNDIQLSMEGPIFWRAIRSTDLYFNLHSKHCQVNQAWIPILKHRNLVRSHIIGHSKDKRANWSIPHFSFIIFIISYLYVISMYYNTRLEISRVLDTFKNTDHKNIFLLSFMQSQALELSYIMFLSYIANLIRFTGCEILR